MKKVIVIGGGLGGMSAAIRLAHAGYQVTVLEQQPTLGGKLQRVVLGGFHFDRGPSTITMPQVFEQVFTNVGRRMEDYVTFYPVDPGTRNHFHDGTSVDTSSDLAKMEAQIAVFSPADAKHLRAFMKESAELYQRADRLFMNRLLLSWRDKTDWQLLGGLLRIRPWLTLDRLLRRYFRHPNTLALFGRYATYVGSAPSHAPAIFAMLAHLELQIGVYSVQGGTYRIVEAFRQLAMEMGVMIRTSVRVDKISSANGHITGVVSSDGDYAADIVIANGDVLSICQDLINESERPSMRNDRITAYEPSLSGFVSLVGSKETFDKLLHHTVFFPEHYGREFYDIFGEGKAAQDPAIYVCHSGYSENGVVPDGGSNLFILANAPSTSPKIKWEEQADTYQRQLWRKLEYYGLSGFTQNVQVSDTFTPDQLQMQTSAYRGAIYGISSNSVRQTFARPSNQANLKGLWFVGGTTHPGGGTPMVTRSGQLVAEAILSR
ncbi:phytoene desaturase [Paenibacillus marchantiophytorum]|uniref:4,4'-diaponeurosporene oxygenase n=1 Tax=Paenibacillus marchantiophytorum TaxID=1619310 RepID=A0ABQ1ENV2_9BACL|nr:phytoene desaturase family protein [Paenibacillus marchantiophytorum]GFZ79376.1 phytoene desaturase [Paenibacillus marchantiophytorum]